MADEAYRAVFLRVHPTGKMVLSLTTEPDGNEGRYAELIATELGIPALDVKVVPRTRTDSASGTGTTRPRPKAPRRRSSARAGRFAQRPSCSPAWHSAPRRRRSNGRTEPGWEQVLTPLIQPR